MAVTQILFRTSTEVVLAASSSSDALLLLLEEPAESPDEVLDLNWAPKHLEDAYRSLLESKHASLISRACEGACVLNSEFPDGPDSHPVYSEIKFHSPSQVKELAVLLALIPIHSLSQVAPHVLPSMDSPVSYLQMQAKNLVDFYIHAAAKKQAVVTWWD